MFNIGCICQIYLDCKSVFWIHVRLDPGFFADPDPDFKNLDPDPSVFCFNLQKQIMGSKLCSLIRFLVRYLVTIFENIFAEELVVQIRFK